jgi:hypothetical protein
MRLEMPCKFRVILGGGHMIYTLFRNEIGGIYDEVKCIFDDGELASTVLSNDDDLSSRQQHWNIYITQIMAGHKELLGVYHNLISELGQYQEAVTICNCHVEKLSEYSKILSLENERLADSEPAIHLSVR